MKVAILWSRLAHYSTAIFRELARSDVQVLIVYRERERDAASPFEDASLSRDIEVIPLVPGDASEAAAVLALLEQFAPDVVVVSGWWSSEYRTFAASFAAKRTPLVLAMDNPWTASARQIAGRIIRRRYLQLFSAVLVPGERAAVLARHLGFGDPQIVKGLYGAPRRHDISRERSSREWPREFLFVGRMEGEKGIDALLGGYSSYRRQVSDPWGLTAVGRGPLLERAQRQQGVTAPGFVQPGEELDSYFRDAGVFVLCSRYDPWPLVLVEAAAAGLPLIATSECGSAVELLRPHFNGLTIRGVDPTAVARGLVAVHHRYDQLRTWGARSLTLAAPYDMPFTARRWREAISVAVGSGVRLREDHEPLSGE